MGPIDLILHWLNLLMPALVTGALLAAAAKLLFRHALRHTAWYRLALWAVLSGSVVLVAGLLLLGRDGKMATYAAMAVAMAVSLLLAGRLWRR